MKKLHLIFLNAEGKKTTLQPKIAIETLTAPIIRDVMTQIAALDLFEKDQLSHYQSVKSAHYTETIKTPIF